MNPIEEETDGVQENNLSVYLLLGLLVEVCGLGLLGLEIIG